MRGAEQNPPREVARGARREVADLAALRERYREEVGADWCDRLTGLPSRAAVGLVLEDRLRSVASGGPAVAVALVDVDGLHAINRDQGLMEGDRVLKAVARALSAGLHPGEVAGRYAGGTFALILTLADRMSAASLAEGVRNEVNKALAGKATVSVGASASWRDGSEGLLAAAEGALRHVKVRGPAWLRVEDSARDGRDDHGLIAVVDDEPVNRTLLKTLLDPLGCEILQCSSGQELLGLTRKAELDLILLDVVMPEMSGFQVCRALKDGEDTRHIPVVLVTALGDTESRVKGIDAGADDYLTKPPNREELVARVRSLLQARKLNRSYTTLESVLFSLANAVEAKDRYTRGHTDRVRSLAHRLGTWLGLSRQELTALDLGGALHDIGKIGVSGEILNKPGPLTLAEWEEMKTHTELGYRICLPLVRALGPALDIVRYHHEKLDGSAYPAGLGQERIGKLVRIMTIVDMYDAMVTDRPYRPALSSEEALRVLREEAANGKLDPGLVGEAANMLTASDTAGTVDAVSPDGLAPTVLVVDQDAADTGLVRTLLRLEGMRVIECTRVSDGLRLARDHRPDLVLLDAQAGPEALTEIRAEPCLGQTAVVRLGAGDGPALVGDGDWDGEIPRPIDTRTFGPWVRSLATHTAHLVAAGHDSTRPACTP